MFRFWEIRKKSSMNTPYKSLPSSNKKIVPNFNNLGTIMQRSIMNSINTIVMIGGFVMLFSVIISILNNTRIFDVLEMFLSPFLTSLNIPTSFVNGFFSGIIELTNGVSMIARIPFKAISLNIIICSFLLGFGGISILLQVLSITSNSDLSIKPYIIGKLMQGAIAAFYTYILLSNFSFLNFDL